MSQSDAAIVEVPAMAGDPGHPASAGPPALTAALAAVGWQPRVSRVEVPPLTAAPDAASAGVSRRVAAAVRETVRAGDWPLVLAGSCDVAPGVIAGLDDSECGIVWIDAHADFNTPASSVSGFWPGMTLAVVVGDCGRELWSDLRSRPIAAERVVLLGVRSLSPQAEAQRLARSAVTVVGWRDGVAEAPVDPPLDALAGRVRRIYVHIDADALDPSIGHGIVDDPVPGGLSQRQLTDLIEAVRARFSIAAATVSTYTPDKDDGRTLPALVAAVQRLVQPSDALR